MNCTSICQLLCRILELWSITKITSTKEEQSTHKSSNTQKYILQLSIRFKPNELFDGRRSYPQITIYLRHHDSESRDLFIQLTNATSIHLQHYTIINTSHSIYIFKKLHELHYALWSHQCCDVRHQSAHYTLMTSSHLLMRVVMHHCVITYVTSSITANCADRFGRAINWGAWTQTVEY